MKEGCVDGPGVVCVGGGETSKFCFNSKGEKSKWERAGLKKSRRDLAAQDRLQYCRGRESRSWGHRTPASYRPSALPATDAG